MENYHGGSPSVKRGTGKKKKKGCDKKLALIGGAFTSTKVADHEKMESRRTTGGNKKQKLMYTQYANIRMPDGKIQKTKINTVNETPSNRHYARGNILIKGAIISTEAGTVRITNRVGQDGVVNAVLLEEVKDGSKPA